LLDVVHVRILSFCKEGSESLQWFEDLGDCLDLWSRWSVETDKFNQEICLAAIETLSSWVFWVGSNTGKEIEGELDPNFRCLKDILSPVVGGLNIPIPPSKFVLRHDGEATVQQHNGVLAHSSLLPWGSPHTISSPIISWWRNTHPAYPDVAQAASDQSSS
jgi:hypothetical protein